MKLNAKYHNVSTEASELMTAGRTQQLLLSPTVKTSHPATVKYLAVLDKACGFIFAPVIRELLSVCRVRHGAQLASSGEYLPGRRPVHVSSGSVEGGHTTDQ